MAGKPLTFGIIGVDHNHIFGMSAGMVEAGARFKAWWTRDQPIPMGQVTLGGNMGSGNEVFPGVPRVRDRRELLDDPEIDLILICSMPEDRAEQSIEALRAGKDVMSDKPAATSLAELKAIRQAMDDSGRIWTVDFSERHHVRACVKAEELVKQGAIGKVVQTIGLGPHRTRPEERPDWFFSPRRSGGVMGYLASHQLDHFMFYTGSSSAEIVSSTVGNFRYPQYEIFEDFGEILLRGDNGLGYVQVSWYSPDHQSHPGDNRLLIIGTEGQIEIRKYTDIGGRSGGNHLFLMTNDRSEHIDCSQVKLNFFDRFSDDLRNRTWTAQPKDHSFVVSELAMKALDQAARLGNLA